MARKRKLLPAVGLILVTVFFATITWLTEEHLYTEHPSYPNLEDFQQAHSTITNENQNGLFARDALCGGCYHAIAEPDKNVRCGFLIFQLMKEKSLSLLDAALAISSHYETPCSRCRPGACSKGDTFYWRYDSKHKSPPIWSSHVPQLQSIPSTELIPPYAISNLTAFFSVPTHAVPPARFLFVYNPSIVLLPSSLDETGFLHAKYLASFRVSTQQSCFHPHETKAMYGGSWDHKPKVEDYLALALLREDLSIIQDVIVDVKASGVFQHFAQDFRLFVLDGLLYLSSFDFISPLWITHQPEDSASKQAVKEGHIQLTNIFPSQLQVSLRQFPSCPVCLDRPNKRCGKNLNYFSTAPGMTWVELWPTGPHITQRVDLTQACSVARKLESTLTVNSDVEYNPPHPAWYTMEEIMFPSMEPSETLLTRERGGACCVSIVDPRTGNDLLVGAFHTKIPKFGKRSGKRLPLWRQSNGNTTKVATNQYLSRWYAFEATPPFPIVALSGLFCLGHPTREEQKDYPLIQTTLWKTMVFGGDGLDGTPEESLLILDCPRIHFISGISEKANDPSRVIVAYGINDCVPRLIEVEKEAIVRALFPMSL